MIAAIILAAGQSRRMGAQKLLLPWRGKTVVAHIADEILRSPIDQTIVVAGRDAAGIAATLAGRSVTIVTTANTGDMLNTVRIGLAALPLDCQAVLVALGDQPSITAELVVQMLHAYRTAGRGIVVPVHDGKLGHPILFSTRYRQEIMTEYDGVGLRGLLLKHPDDMFELPVSTGSVLTDMDYPEDYRRELAKLTSPPGLTS
jgi:molybdenum cofactor cytidylyltransferase